MFIPDKKQLQVGSKVKLTRDIKTFGGIFTAGHRFIVYSIGERGPNLVDIDGRKLDEMGLSVDALKVYGFGKVP